MLVATPLVPSESVATNGSGVVLVLMWLVLALFMCLRYMSRPEYHGPVLIDLLIWALVLTQVISGLIAGPAGSMRPVINTVWAS